MTTDYDYGAQMNHAFHFFFSLLFSHYITDIIKKTGIAFTGSFGFNQVKFGRAQISVPKIDTRT